MRRVLGALCFALVAFGQQPLSQQIRYKHTASGAASRSLRTRLTERVSALDFGCVPDDATDNSTCLQTLITYAQANKVVGFIPAGIYRFGTTLEMQGSYIYLVGEGNASSLLKYTGSGNAINVGTLGASYRLGLKDLNLSSTQGSGVAQKGLNLINAQQMKIESVQVGNSPTTGFAIGVHVGSASTTAGLIWIRQLYLDSNTVGVYVQDSVVFDLRNADVFKCTTPVKIKKCVSCSIENGWFEHFQQVFLVDEQAASLVNVNFIGNSGSTTDASGFTDPRVFKVDMSAHATGVFWEGRVESNEFNLDTTTHGLYGMEIKLGASTSNTVRLNVSDNLFWGVTTSGINTDTTVPIIRVRDNDSRNQYSGTPVANYSGSGTYFVDQVSPSSTVIYEYTGDRQISARLFLKSSVAGAGQVRLEGTNEVRMDMYRLGLGAGRTAFVGQSNTVDGSLVLSNTESADGDIVLSPKGNIQLQKLIRSNGTAFASLGAPAPGNMTWCTDCVVATPCAGAGTGAWAFRTATPTWNCPF